MTLVPDYVMLFAKLFNKKQKHNNRINQKHNCSMMVRSCLIKVCILTCFKFVRNVCVSLHKSVVENSIHLSMTIYTKAYRQLVL